MSALSLHLPSLFRSFSLIFPPISTSSSLNPRLNTTPNFPILNSTPFSLSCAATQISSNSQTLDVDVEPHYLSCSMRGKSLKVAVLVSGGVDSSVALRLLHAAGHSCTAFYLKIWFQVLSYCPFTWYCLHFEPWNSLFRYILSLISSIVSREFGFCRGLKFLFIRHSNWLNIWMISGL